MKEVLRVYWFLLFLFLVTSLAHGQVRRDSASRIRFGTAVPATCNPSIGSVFFLITPGSPLGMHQCLATDTWSPMVGSMSGVGANNQVAIFTAPSEIEGSNALTFDDATTDILTLATDTTILAWGAAGDAQMHRGDAADIIEQRRGLNDQEWRLYDRFVSHSDYDRLEIYVGGGPPVKVFEINAATTDAGTGGIDLKLEAVPGLSGGVVRLVTGTSQVQLSQTGFIFNPGDTVSVLNADNFEGGGTMQLGLAETVSQIGIDLRIASIQPGTGQRDSHSFNMSGRSDNGNPFEAQWKTQVVMDSDDGDSSWVLSERVNCCGAFATAMQITHTAQDAGQFTIPNRGPHSFGTAIDFQHQFTFGADYLPLVLGADLTIVKFRLENGARGVAGATTSLYGMDIDINLQTQAAAESIGNLASLNVEEPNINFFLTGGGVITQASTLRIGGAPTEGAANFALLVESGLSSFGGDVDITGNIAIAGVGPHSIAGVTFGAVQLLIGSTFTSDGASNIAAGLFHTPAIVGAPGDTDALTGTTLTAGITTQTATESIADIAQLQINEPNITDNLTGTITQASTVLITGAPTEGTRNYALNVEDGSVRFASTGPHVIGGVPQNFVAFTTVGNFTSGGVSNQAYVVRHAMNLLGATGDTVRLAGMDLANTITTQTATESIANVAQLIVTEPVISDNLTGSITQASTVLITGAPTEGVSNDALRIVAGRSFFGDQLIVDDDSTEAFQVRKAGDAGDVFNVNTASDIVRMDAGLKVVGTVGSSFGSAPPMTITSAFTIDTTFTAGVSGTSAHALDIFPDFTGAAGHTTALSLLTINGNISTQTATESIANISTMALNEPSITDNLTGTITNAQTLLIFDAPTAGVSNFAFRVVSGLTQYGGTVQGATTGSYALLNEAATAINPTVAPNRLLLGTGISAVDNEGAGSLHIVVDDTSVFNASLTNINANITNTFEVNGAFFVDGLADTIQMRVDAHSTQLTSIFRVRDSSAANIMTISDNGRVEGGAGSAWALMNEGATTTNPSILTNKNDTNTGLGGNSTAVSLIVSSVSRFHATTTGVGFNAQTPIARPDYTATATAVEDRTLLASASATTINNNNVLAALIADLIEYGLLQ